MRIGINLYNSVAALEARTLRHYFSEGSEAKPELIDDLKACLICGLNAYCGWEDRNVFEWIDPNLKSRGYFALYSVIKHIVGWELRTDFVDEGIDILFLDLDDDAVDDIERESSIKAVINRAYALRSDLSSDSRRKYWHKEYTVVPREEFINLAYDLDIRFGLGVFYWLNHEVEPRTTVSLTSLFGGEVA